MALSAEQLEFFHSQGYLVVEEFASPEECQTLMRRMDELVEEFDPASMSIFSTKNQNEHTGNYFYDSASNISFFFEEKAFDENGALKQPKALSINKVGHALHDLDPVFETFSYSNAVRSLLASLRYKQPVLIQSMYIFKQPGIGGEVVPHQDNSFLSTSPQSCTGLWLAVEEANVENGCLWVLPQSHKGGLARRFIRGDWGVKYDGEPAIYHAENFVPVEVKAGSLVLLHGDLVHQSFENTSPKSRQAYSVHVVETESCTWASDNWLQRSKDLPARPISLTT